MMLTKSFVHTCATHKHFVSVEVLHCEWKDKVCQSRPLETTRKTFVTINLNRHLNHPQPADQWHFKETNKEKVAKATLSQPRARSLSMSKGSMLGGKLCNNYKIEDDFWTVEFRNILENNGSTWNSLLWAITDGWLFKKLTVTNTHSWIDGFMKIINDWVINVVQCLF